MECFSSPTAKIVRCALRAPEPAKNSPVSRRMISCFGRHLRLVGQNVIDALIELVMN
jgi:hypothetical protein